MNTQGESAARVGLATRIEILRSLDTTHTCQMRLLALRTRIEGNWPAGRTLFRRGQGLAAQTAATIEDLLVALPTPLPLKLGGDPESIICDTDTDLRAVAGRAVDAGLALLDGFSLESPYPGEVAMLASWRQGAQEPILISNPAVGLLVATIIGTLEAIAETIAESGPKPASKDKQAAPDGARAGTKPADGPAEGKAAPGSGRGPVVPRI